MIYDLAVIGSGPAGMIAACRASERGARVILLEKNKSLGMKLIMTGHGRCNITNTMADSREMIGVYGRNGKFLFSAFNKFSVEDTLNFFSGLGVAFKEEDNGRIFPKSGRAGDIQNVLNNCLTERGVEIKLGAKVEKIKTEGNKINKVILGSHEEIFAKNFLISTGGQSYPETGSTGDGYKWLTGLGHNVIKTRPALTPIVVKEKIVKSLEGLSLTNAGIAVYQNNKKIINQTGEIIFTADGLSGPAIIDLSRHIGALLPAPVVIKIDFQPEIKLSEFEKRIQNDFHHSHNKIFKNYLAGIIQPKLFPVIINLTGIDESKQVNIITRQERGEIVRALKEFTLEIKELKGFNKAMITAGGINVKEVNPKTMRSRFFENLYLAGEILDLDGPTGGYNLQICWSTGYTAGDSVLF